MLRHISNGKIHFTSFIANRPTLVSDKIHAENLKHVKSADYPGALCFRRIQQHTAAGNMNQLARLSQSARETVVHERPQPSSWVGAGSQGQHNDSCLCPA